MDRRMTHHTNDRDRAAHQVSMLKALKGRNRRRRLLALFAERRKVARRDVGGLRRTPFELVTSLRAGFDDIPVVPRSVIVRTSDIRSLTAALDAAGYAVVEERPVGELDDVWRLTVDVRRGQGPPPSSDLKDILAMVRGLEGVNDASLDHVAALAGRAKGGCTPEHTSDPLEGRSITEVADDPLVIVIDTGIAADAVGHGARPRTDGWLDGVTMDVIGGHIDPLDATGYLGDGGPDGDNDLAAGHGTFVAGLIRQGCPEANVMVLRVLDTDGFADEELIVDAIARAGRIFQEHGGRGILNLSLGTESVDGDSPPVGLAAAVSELPPDVVVTAAAGNGDTGIPMWPAAMGADHAHVLGVASVVVPPDATDPTPADLVGSEWSNRGSWVRFSAVGEGVVSTFVNGSETASQSSDDPYDDMPETWDDDDPYALWAGTSFATAKVTGALACIMAADGSITPSAAVAELETRGEVLSNFGVALLI